MDVPYPLRPVFKPPLTYGSLALPSRYLLSPLAGFTNLSFRRVVHELGGVGLTTTDLVNARGLLTGKPEDAVDDRDVPGRAALCRADLRRRGGHPLRRGPVPRSAGRPFGRHQHGLPGRSDHPRRSRREHDVPGRCDDRAGAASRRGRVDPRDGEDAARLGQAQITAPKFAREFEQAGVAAVAIHGRTREQGFSGQVDRDGIRRVVEAVERIPVIGNGDIRTIADAARMLVGDRLRGHFRRPRRTGKPVDLPAARRLGRDGPLRPAGEFRRSPDPAQAAVRLPGGEPRHAVGHRACSARRPTGT